VNVSAPFIHRPIATSLLAAAILLAGAVAYVLLPVAPLPKVDFPTIQVSGQLPGASPETMASSVATPLERRFGRIAGVTEITSTSVLGSTAITLQFDLDRDVDAAGRDVQAAIAAAGGELPPGLPTRPTFRKVNPSDSPIMILSLKSDQIPLPVIYDQANTIFAEKISQIHGVGQVYVGGGQQPAVRIQVDPVALAGMGLGLEDVRKAIAATTSNQPKGALMGASQAFTLGGNTQLFSAAEFKDIILAYQNGAAVRLGDVAKVFDDVENSRVAAWVNGERAILLIIRRQPGANILETCDLIKRVLPQLQNSISPAIKVEISSDRTQSIRASVSDVEHTLVLSVVLVVVVVFVFLRTLSATAIPSVVVPLSLVATFGLMYLAGYSLDNLSLMALTISTGFVVDDAIVVTENIARFIELGEPPLRAALRGAKQIGFTIISITVSLLAVFIPILLMGGIVGRLFREFAVTLSMAIAVSAIVSLTLTPMMCSRLLRPTSESHGRLYLVSERVFASMVGLYDRGLRWVLRHQALMLVATIGAVVATVALFVAVPKGLFPQQDTGLITGFSDAPQDVSFPSMKARQEAMNKVIGEDPDILYALEFTGAGGNNGTTGNTGSAFIQLKPKPPRKASADEIINRLRPKLAKVEGLRLFLQSRQDVSVGGRTTRTQYQYTLEDANIGELNAFAPRMLAQLQKIPELRDVASDQQTNGLELDVDFDRETASRMGITAQAVDAALYDAFGQEFVATSFTQMNQYHVVLELKPEYLKTPDALRAIYVPAGPTQSPTPVLTAGAGGAGVASPVGGGGPPGSLGSVQSTLLASATANGAVSSQGGLVTPTRLPVAMPVIVDQSSQANLAAQAAEPGSMTSTSTLTSASAVNGAVGPSTPPPSGTQTATPFQTTQVPLMSFAKLSTSKTSLSINHQGQFPAVTISFNLAPGKSLSQAVEAIQSVAREIGIPASIHGNFQGTAQAFNASLSSEPVLLLAALFSVYIVLGVLYESTIHPITILSTLPSAGVGALVALFLCRTEFTIIALVGIILLIGIVKKNAIMMIDFALEAEREEGMPRVEAIHQACLLRFRPIMMTTLAALLGGLPLALGTGTGSEMRRPLGITIVGGLVLSQVLTLYSTPVIYLWLDRLSGAKRSPLRGPDDDDRGGALRAPPSVRFGHG
jgi:multidrug efflux pump subunit AcrB